MSKIFRGAWRLGNPRTLVVYLLQTQFVDWDKAGVVRPCASDRPNPLRKYRPCYWRVCESVEEEDEVVELIEKYLGCKVPRGIIPRR